MTTKEIINKHLEQWRDKLKSNIDTKKLNASGALKESIKVKDTTLVGNDYIYYLLFGRKPTQTTQRGNPTLQQLIYKWIDQKGISYSDEREHLSMSYAISRKIHNKGIIVPNGHNDGKLLSDSVTDADKQSLIKELGGYYTLTITEMIKKTWQQSQ